jgi:hypothetical protein
MPLRAAWFGAALLLALVVVSGSTTAPGPGVLFAGHISAAAVRRVVPAELVSGFTHPECTSAAARARASSYFTSLPPPLRA